MYFYLLSFLITNSACWIYKFRLQCSAPPLTATCSWSKTSFKPSVQDVKFIIDHKSIEINLLGNLGHQGGQLDLVAPGHLEGHGAQPHPMVQCYPGYPGGKKKCIHKTEKPDKKLLCGRTLTDISYSSQPNQAFWEDKLDKRGKNNPVN